MFHGGEVGDETINEQKAHRTWKAKMKYFDFSIFFYSFLSVLIPYLPKVVITLRQDEEYREGRCAQLLAFPAKQKT